MNFMHHWKTKSTLKDTAMWLTTRHLERTPTPDSRVPPRIVSDTTGILQLTAKGGNKKKRSKNKEGKKKDRREGKRTATEREQNLNSRQKNDNLSTNLETFSEIYLKFM